MLLPFLSSLLGIIAFLPLNCYPASLVFLIPLFIFFLKENKLWRLVAGAFIFKIVFALGAAYFTLEPIAWASELLIIFFLPLNIWLAKKLLHHLCQSQPINFFNKELALLFLLPFLFTLSDILQARFSLLPSYIMAAGNSLGSSPFLGLAGLGGITFLTFFAALINALLAALFLKLRSLYKNKNNSPAPEKKTCFVLAALLVLALLAGWLISFWQLNKNTDEYNSKTSIIKIAVLSAKESLYPAQFEETKKELTKQQIDLLVLPENIFYDPANPAYFSNNYTGFMQNLAQEIGANVIAVFDTFQEQKKYNSAVLFNKLGETIGIHSKFRITFAGEYWPFGSWQPPLSDLLKKSSPEIKNFAVFDPKNAYSRGQQNNLNIVSQNKSVVFAAPVCLEIQYPDDLKYYRQTGAQFIVNPSSNRWVGTGLKHFLYLTGNLKKIEAVWLGLPVISSGVKDYAGLTLPNGQTFLKDSLESNLNYTLFFGEIKY
ncbi:MAG TPA: nitrilase-related carbon-nitrogen hydrolase [Candidatus Portnoybacteria bacterium]|nr:nitrilase-related carbon-nitrogen hydrolase [Candidatus Portnoybacteria bacterium]